MATPPAVPPKPVLRKKRVTADSDSDKHEDKVLTPPTPPSTLPIPAQAAGRSSSGSSPRLITSDGEVAKSNDADTVPEHGKDGQNDVSSAPKAQPIPWPDKVPSPGMSLRRRKLARFQDVRSALEAENPEDVEEGVAHRWYAGYRTLSHIPDYMNPRTYGLYAELSRYRPRIEVADHSLIQILVAYEGPEDPSLPPEKQHVQTLEAGWLRFDHDVQTEVFIFFTTNNYGPNGWGLGGYVSVEEPRGYQILWNEPGNSFRPGRTFFPASHIGQDPPQTVSLEWHLMKKVSGRADGWYLAVNGVWNGYFPLSIFERGHEDPTTTLADHATSAEFYGEIFDKDFDRRLPPEIPQVRTSTDMGTGHWPRDGHTKAAFISNIMRLTRDSEDGAQQWEDVDDATFYNTQEPGGAADKTMYDIEFFPNSNTTMGSHCYLGGPGAALPPGKWNEWEDLGGIAILGGDLNTPNPKGRGPKFEPLACICIVELQPSLTQLFIMGPDGRIYHSTYDKNNDWTGFNNKGEWTKLDFGQGSTPVFEPTAKFTVVARSPTDMAVLGVSKEGKVHITSWNPNTGFVAWTDISKDTRFTSGAPIQAVSRFSKQLDVFINQGGLWGVFHASWNEDSGLPPPGSDDEPQAPEWSNWVSLGGELPDKAPILVLTRSQQTINIFGTREQDGHVLTNGFQEGLGWAGWGNIGVSAPDTDFDPPHDTRFAAGGKIAGLARGASRMDLFCVASDHRLYTTSWTLDGGWAGVGDIDRHWVQLGAGENPAGDRVFDSLTSDVAAVARDVTGDLDVFVTGRTGWIHRTHWTNALNIWSSRFGAFGWDSKVGGERSFVTQKGFHIAVTSRTADTLTLVAIDGEGAAVTAEYDMGTLIL